MSPSIAQKMSFWCIRWQVPSSNMPPWLTVPPFRFVVADPLESSAGMTGALQSILDTDFKLPMEGLPPYQGKPQWGAGGRAPGSRGLSGPSLGTPIPTMSTMMATQVRSNPLAPPGPPDPGKCTVKK